MLHGLANRAQAWDPLVGQLDQTRWRAVGIDLLGFGSSPKPADAKYDVSEHTAAVVAAIRRLKLKQPLVIVAHSMGCLIAVHIATRHPKLVRRLILFEPPLFADNPEFKSHAKRRKFYFKVYGQLASRPQLVFAYKRILGRAASRLSGLLEDEPVWTAFERSLRNTIMEQAAYDELHKIDVPTDIIHGRLDLIVTRTDLKRMFKTNPHISFHAVNEMHGISKRAARYIVRLLEVKAG